MIKIDKEKIEGITKNANCIIVASDKAMYVDGNGLKILSSIMAVLDQLNYPKEIVKETIDYIYQNKNKENTEESEDDIESLEEEEPKDKQPSIKDAMKKDLEKFLDDIFED